MHLKRHKEQALLSWSKSKIRSPLVLIGPRQVGKTTTLKMLAQEIGKKVYEINFWQDANGTLKRIFQKSGDPHKILSDLADYFEVASIDQRNDVLFIDEIQECKEAYSSLKSFKEKIPELKILVTGSYLQLFLKNEELIKLPVGCVDEFHLGPMLFSEFLENRDLIAFEKFQKLSVKKFEISEALHEKLMTYLTEYFFTGGLPEIVKLHISGKINYESKQLVRKKQTDIINQYLLDFQKYGKGAQIKKIDKIFQSIPFQLEKTADDSTDRFQFKQIGQDIKYSTLHLPFQFLKNAGLIIRSFIVSKVDQPFRVHEKLEERNLFKCFYFDMGLLGASLNSPLKFNLSELGSYKGYIAENYVAIVLNSRLNSELITYKKSSKADSAEVEFLIADSRGNVIPIEVKSSKKSLQSKSLASFINEYKPKHAYKLVPTSCQDSNNQNYTCLPLYMIERI